MNDNLFIFERPYIFRFPYSQKIISTEWEESIVFLYFYGDNVYLRKWSNARLSTCCNRNDGGESVGGGASGPVSIARNHSDLLASRSLSTQYVHESPGNPAYITILIYYNYYDVFVHANEHVIPSWFQQVLN